MRTTDVVKVKEIEEMFSRPDNYEEIKEDIRSRGIQEAVVVNTNNELLCGYTRLAIAEELSIDEIPHRSVDITDPDEMEDYADYDNLHRRQLTDLQVVKIGMRIEERHKRKQGRPQKSGQNVLNLGKQSRDIVVEKIQEQTGKNMSGRKYSRLKTIVTKAVKEVHDKLNAGEITQKEALALTKVSPEKQVEICRSGKSIKSQVFKALRPEREPTPLPEGKFRVIYADPPWRYDNTIRNWGPAELHYSTMSLEDICDMGQAIAKIAADNAALFLWVTNPFLQDALEVVRAWGFEYKTNMVWAKTNLKKPGMGFYVRGHHELLFICTRGSFVPDQQGQKPISSVISADVREHSQKPDEVYKVIEQMYPGEKYLELFARQKRRGWQVWGNEV